MRRAFPLLLLGLLVCGCGSSRHVPPLRPPTPQQFLSRLGSALDHLGSFHARVGLVAQLPNTGGTIGLQASGSGDIAPQMASFQLTVSFQRGVSATGKFAVVLGPHAGFLDYRRHWYKEKGLGYAEIRSLLYRLRYEFQDNPLGLKLGSRAAQADIEFARRWPSLLRARVSSGPTVDGQRTWRLDGSPDFSAIGRLLTVHGFARMNGLLAHIQRVSVLLGVDDQRLERFQISYAGPLVPGQILHAQLTISMSAFGEDVPYSPPAHFQVLNLPSFRDLPGILG